MRAGVWNAQVLLRELRQQKIDELRFGHFSSQVTIRCASAVRAILVRAKSAPENHESQRVVSRRAR